MEQFKAAGILPYAHHNGNIYFLLGRENYNIEIIPENNDLIPNKEGKFCDFGGSRDPEDNDSKATAIREFYEESMGIIMDKDTIKEKLEDISTFIYYNKKKYYVQYAVQIDYNEDIPIYYNRVRQYLDKCMTYKQVNTITNKHFFRQTIPCCPEGYIEKIEMKWMTIKEIIKNIDTMREEFRKSFLCLCRDNFITQLELE